MRWEILETTVRKRLPLFAGAVVSQNGGRLYTRETLLTMARRPARNQTTWHKDLDDHF